MSKNLIIIVICALLLACSESRGPTVAKVNNTSIDAEALKMEMTIESGKYDPILLGTDANFTEFRKQALDKLIQESILLEEAKSLNITASDDELEQGNILQTNGIDKKQLEGWLDQHNLKIKDWNDILRKRIVIDKLIKAQVYDKIPIEMEQIEAYYEKHIQSFRQPTQFRVRQIIVDTREEADKIMAELKRGADFAELASKHSLSPDSKRGGDLGYFDSSAYPEVFTEVCQNLDIGETSDIVVTDYGYQIFQLVDKRPARQLSLSEVEQSIKAILTEADAEVIFKEWLADMEKKYEVYIDKKALSEVGLDDKNS